VETCSVLVFDVAVLGASSLARPCDDGAKVVQAGTRTKPWARLPEIPSKSVRQCEWAHTDGVLFVCKDAVVCHGMGL